MGRDGIDLIPKRPFLFYSQQSSQNVPPVSPKAEPGRTCLALRVKAGDSLREFCQKIQVLRRWIFCFKIPHIANADSESTPLRVHEAATFSRLIRAV